DQFTGPPSGILASCWSVIRAGQPPQYERLIPSGAATPFVTGLERDVPGPNPVLLTDVQTQPLNRRADNSQPRWPLITWWKSWKTPSGERWNFGHVTAGKSGNAPQLRVVPVSWNSVGFVNETN
ncbi:MAG TPA: hypothetical protein VGE41_08370, partial [Verrucomicrobiae bacterium]